MPIEAIDSVFLAVRDLDSCRQYERIGLKLSPTKDNCRMLQIGSPGNLFSVHFHAKADDTRPLFAVGLRVTDLAATVRDLEAKGVRAERFRDDEKWVWLPTNEQAGTDLVLVQHARSVEERHSTAMHAGLLNHALPLRRLDHLAAITHDLDAKTRFWAETLNVPVTGEVTTPAMVIRQLMIGDAVMELLGPATSDSPVWKRPAGLVSMASWEVADLDVVVSQVRAAGLTVSDPAVGPLPETRIATVQGSDLAGVNMQLLQYVR